MWTLTCEDVENIPPRSQMKFLINFTFYKWDVLQRNVLKKFTSWLKRILQRRSKLNTNSFVRLSAEF